MRRRITYCLLFLFVIIIANAQQDPTFTQYELIQGAYNPAYAGMQGKITARALYRSQWRNFAGGPVTQAFVMDAPLNYNRIGLGLSVLHENTGLEDHLALKAAYNYRVLVSDGLLSLGLAAGVYQYRLAFDDLIIRDPDDQVVSGAVQFVPEFGFGAFYQKAHYYLGFAVQHLSEPNLDFGGNSSGGFQRHYYFNAGYRFTFSEAFSLEPMVLIRMAEQAKLDIRGGVKVIYKNIGWIGTVLDSGKQWSITSGVSLEEIVPRFTREMIIGYAFSLDLSGLSSFQAGTHEVVLIYNFKVRPNPEKIKKKKRIISPLFFE